MIRTAYASYKSGGKIYCCFFNAVKVAVCGSSPDGETVKDVRKNVYLNKELKDVRDEVVTDCIQ